MWLWLFPLAVPLPARSALAEGRPSCIPLSRTAQAVHLTHRNHLTEALHLLGDHLNELPPLKRDELRLLQAAIRLRTPDAQNVFEDLIDLPAFLQGRRVLQALCWMLMAQAQADRGSLPLATELLSRAEHALTAPQGRPLRSHARALKVGLLASAGDHQRADQLASHALKVARGDLERYLAHRTIAVWHRDPLDRSAHAMAAQLTAPGPRERAEAAALYRSAFAQLGGARPAAPARSSRQVHLQLLDAPQVQVDGQVIHAGGTPRLVLLLTYLLMHPGRTLAQVAEDLLPLDDAAHLKHHDEAHRIARIRRDVSRARTLLADPAAILCTQGTLHLDPTQHWSSDLHQALQASQTEAVLARLPGTVNCEWLDQLRTGTPATPG